MAQNKVFLLLTIKTKCSKMSIEIIKKEKPLTPTQQREKEKNEMVENECIALGYLMKLAQIEKDKKPLECVRECFLILDNLHQPQIKAFVKWYELNHNQSKE